MEFFRNTTQVSSETGWQTKPVSVEVNQRFNQLHAVLIDFTAEFDNDDHHMGKISIQITEPKLIVKPETPEKYKIEYNVSVLFRDQNTDDKYTFIVNTLLMADNAIPASNG
jgi:hypothetical protein